MPKASPCAGRGDKFCASGELRALWLRWRFCDGTHTKLGFDRTETASRKPYREQAKMIQAHFVLSAAETLCAFAHFCDPNGHVWRLMGETDQAEAKRDFIRQTCNCPSVLFVAWDNTTGEPIDPHFEPSIGLIEDLVEDRYGPLGVRGGVSVISADDFPYEIGNRVTLCWRRVTKQALLRRLARRDQVQGRSLGFGGVIVPERRPAAGVSRSRP
jgi:hypothetical protein